MRFSPTVVFLCEKMTSVYEDSCMFFIFLVFSFHCMAASAQGLRGDGKAHLSWIHIFVAASFQVSTVLHWHGGVSYPSPSF